VSRTAPEIAFLDKEAQQTAHTRRILEWVTCQDQLAGSLNLGGWNWIGISPLTL